MNEQERTAVSKAISRVLRHRPDSAGVALDAQGWCAIDGLLEGLASTGLVISPEQLAEIVRSNDKQRFAFSDDGSCIRANQGHSVGGVKLKLREKVPPSRLFHGTVAASLTSIEKHGLMPMNRHHVHLSADITTARSVGGRRGTPLVLEVDAHRMHCDGIKFQLSENGIWLVDVVPTKYLKRAS